MPLFPEIDLARLLSVPNGAEAFGPGDPSGVMAGLNASLIALLRNFQPGDLGVCVVDEKIQLSLPIAEWATWGWNQQDTITLGAGASAVVTVFTVPNDERIWLDYARCGRSSGDNDFRAIQITPPAGYSSLAANYSIMSLATLATSIYWPSGQQTADVDVPGPILLEPGTIIQLLPGGTGVAATNVRIDINMRRTKMVRALAP